MGISLIFQLHILLPLLQCYFGLACEAQKQGTWLELTSSGRTRPIQSVCAEAHFGISSPFRESSYKSCISAVNSRLDWTRELNASIIMLSNTSFRPSISNIFDIVYFSHTDNALDLLNHVKLLSLVSAANCAHRYFPVQTALLLTKANSHSSTWLFSVQLFLIEVTPLHVFYTCNNQNATIRISISNTMKKSEGEDTVKMAPITDSCRTCIL